ncbi:isocitrate dehydrogenase kinase/phosphatase [Pantoea ananatis]|nr:isocitrate dehydrogenase kinase/phosphatase [Pantoea ananatis]
MPPRESLIAHTILQGFDAQYGRFLDITAGALPQAHNSVLNRPNGRRYSRR